MRFYDLTLTTGPASQTPGQVYSLSPTTGAFVYTAAGQGVTSFTSHVQTPSGLVYNPGALNIEWDMPVAPLALPQGKQLIRVWGVGIQAISQAFDLNGASFVLKAGMQQGIAGVNGLANPKQIGTIAQGSVFQGFGNWQGVNQTLELIVIPGLNNAENDLLSDTLPNGITLDWQPGQPLSAALNQALAAALPGYQISQKISADLKPPNNAPFQTSHSSLQTFAKKLQDVTQPIGADATDDDNYPGVQVVVAGPNVQTFDYTQPGAMIQLNFQDLIGQPTWISAAQVSFKTVMRGDIGFTNLVKFPTGVVTPYALTSPNAAVPGAPARANMVFKGSFQITEIHHYANYRQADADSWCTAFLAVPVSDSNG